MAKARKPEIVVMHAGTYPDAMRAAMSRVGLSMAEGVEPREGLNVAYPDRRVMPKRCDRTNMWRDFCCCSACRSRRRRNHRANCDCWLCIADRMGAFVDSLGERTALGRWVFFVTLTYRTPHFPWAKRFPIEQPTPSPEFVRHFFARAIRFLEKELHERVEYFEADQFGETGGRLHQHFGISSPSLPAYEWKPFQKFLWDGAGFNRILPWELDAGFYIGRYIGRDAGRCAWDFRVADEPVRVPVSCGRSVVAVSPAVPNEGGFLSSAEYRRSMGRWHR